MDNKHVKIIPYIPEYAEQTVKMWRDSKFKAIGVNEIHSFESHIYFLKNILIKEFIVELAIVNEKVAGMIAYHQSEISQLYVHNHFQQLGIGKILLQRAKEQSTGRLTLRTFEVNKNAQRFYEKNGFTVIGRGHENEENLPDLLYEWKASV
ncbi:GNAT family N-acetyltransferase [Fictibacillus phosphorivorans]|uniref:GNAT family N-acetyltransferase n=1 Tax=Fictibacillus phosphorivorans TaxID=1221500 RepID=UPI0021B16DFD|nr:GNAT family N-acetyltransferase [Fictibacillus phosphorivorans]